MLLEIDMLPFVARFFERFGPASCLYLSAMMERTERAMARCRARVTRKKRAFGNAPMGTSTGTSAERLGASTESVLEEGKDGDS